MIQLGCKGCVHEKVLHNSGYFGDCENCCRNPNYSDFYFKEEREMKASRTTEE